MIRTTARIVGLAGDKAKAVILLWIIVGAIAAEAAGVDVGLDLEHYVVLLLTDLGVYAIPNRDPATP